MNFYCSDLSCPFYMPTWIIWRTVLKEKVRGFAFSRDLLRFRSCCVHTYLAIHFSLILILLVYFFYSSRLGIFKRHWLPGLPMCAFCRKTYSPLAKRICTKLNLIHHTSNTLSPPPGTTIKYNFKRVEFQRVMSFNSADFAFAAKLCCVNTPCENTYYVPIVTRG